MKSQPSASRFLLLLLAAPAWGQSPPLPAGSGVQRPLNLSVPRDVISKQGSIIVTELEDTATRNLRQEELKKEAHVERQPYGTGYETRQRGAIFGGGSDPGSGRAASVNTGSDIIRGGTSSGALGGSSGAVAGAGGRGMGRGK